MQVQRWTLAVVCAATAMLMLDIAVVNTALSDIAVDLDTGPLGPAVGRRRLHARPRGDGPDRRRARRPARPPPALHRSASRSSPPARSVVRWPATSPCSTACAPCRASAPRSCSPSRSRCSPPPIPTCASAPARSPPTARRSAPSFAVGPLVGGALTSGLDWRWIFLINLPIGLLCIAATRAYVQESRDPAARGIDWPGQATLTAGLFLLVLALLRGHEDGWTSALDPRRVRRRRWCCSPRSWPSRRAWPSRCSRWGCSATARSPAPRSPRSPSPASFFAIFLYTTLYLQQILGLSAIEAGLTYLPGTITMLFVSAATSTLGALVPAQAALGGGSPQEYVDGFHDALLAGAALAAVGAVAAWLRIPPLRRGGARPGRARRRRRRRARIRGRLSCPVAGRRHSRRPTSDCSALHCACARVGSRRPGEERHRVAQCPGGRL